MKLDSCSRLGAFPAHRNQAKPLATRRRLSLIAFQSSPYTYSLLSPRDFSGLESIQELVPVFQSPFQSRFLSQFQQFKSPSPSPLSFSGVCSMFPESVPGSVPLLSLHNSLLTPEDFIGLDAMLPAQFAVQPSPTCLSLNCTSCHVQVDGTILGPLEPSSYPPAEYTSQYFPYTNGLLTFRNFRGLEIVGGGTVEGQGFIFWQRFREKTLHLPIRPFAIRLMRCIDTYVRGITLR